MKQLICYIILILSSTLLSAQVLVSVDFQKNSFLTINGSTNIIPFKLSENIERISKKNISVTTIQSQNKVVLSQNQFLFAVNSFTSDNKMALRDFLKLMKSDEYPNMQVEVNALELQPNADQQQLINGKAIVNITITGVTKQYAIPISYIHEGDLFNVNGKKKMSIRDFKLIPPIQLMGLIKVSEWIDIDFHLVCKITTENTANL